MKRYYSPLRYPGGKDSIFDFVSSLIRENGLIGINYAEPFAGGAGLALHLLCSEYVGKIYINDIAPSIYSFWHVILNRTDEFCKWIEKVEVDIDTWKFYKGLQSSLDEFELAQSTFFLNRTNISGVLKAGPIGGVSQKGKYKIGVRFNKADLIDRIRIIAQFRDRIVVTNEDGICFLNGLNRRKDNYFINLDPPYYEDGKDLYLNFYNDNEHIKLHRYINKLRKYWMLTYDNVSFINDLYKAHNIIKYRLRSGTSNGMGEEVIMLSEELEYNQSLHKLTLL